VQRQQRQPGGRKQAAEQDSDLFEAADLLYVERTHQPQHPLDDGCLVGSNAPRRNERCHRIRLSIRELSPLLPFPSKALAAIAENGRGETHW
jgi:hypothetical protein